MKKKKLEETKKKISCICSTSCDGSGCSSKTFSVISSSYYNKWKNNYDNNNHNCNNSQGK